MRNISDLVGKLSKLSNIPLKCYDVEHFVFLCEIPSFPNRFSLQNGATGPIYSYFVGLVVVTWFALQSM